MSSTPTIPIPVINNAGISGPAYNDILTALTQIFQSIYGNDIIVTPDSQDGQWLAVLALGYFDYGQLLIAVFNSMSPQFAQGAQLSSLVKINGLARLIPSNSTAVVTIVGQAGSVITGGVAQDQAGNLWDLPPTVTIPGGGSISVTVTAEQVGAIVAPANTITNIFTPTLGWQSVTNPAAAVVGSPVEADAVLRQRQSISTGQPAQTPVQAIIAAVANLPGVGRARIYENPTNATDSNGIPAHSISVVVQGGNLTQIAQTIEQKKSPGTGTFGTTIIVVNDPGGLSVAINFYQLTFVQIWVNITIVRQPTFLAATATAIINNIVNFINNLPIGQAVVYNWLLSIAQAADTVPGLTYAVTVLQVGTAPSPTGVIDVPIPFNQAATTVVANIVLTQA